MRPPARAPGAWGCVLLAGSALLAGCASAPARYYALSAEPHVGAGDASEAACWIAVGPVLIPALLDRPQIVRRGERHEVRVAENERWAEPLGSMLARTLREDLAARLGLARVVSAGLVPSGPPWRTLSADVSRFEAGPSGEVDLVAQWTLAGPGGPGRTQSVVVRVGAGSASTEATVAALSLAVAQWADAVAASCLRLPAQAGGSPGPVRPRAG